MSSSDESSENDDFLFPSTDPGAEEFEQPRRKRRKIGRDARESAALGVFGSESEDERPGQKWKQKDLRGKGVGFVKADTQGDEQGDAPNGEDEDEDMSDDERINSRLGLGGGSRGLGFGASAAKSVDPEDSGNETLLGAGFTPTSAREAFTSRRSFAPEPASSPRARPSNFGGSAKKPSTNKGSFASKMMAKMGYVEGQGLGSSGQGIINPIETKLRPQLAGLGAVREKTQQAKEEAKREAARRGETFEDSSEEERKRKKKAKERRRQEGGSGASTPVARPKVKYRTAADIEAATTGLEVPNVLKSLIDATGQEQKLLTSTSGLMTPGGSAPVDTESTKVAKRAKRDLEAFADAWTAETEKKKFIEVQEEQTTSEIDKNQQEADRLLAIINTLGDLNLGVSGDLQEQWEQAVSALEILQLENADDIDELGLTEAAVAGIEPMFRREMDEWSPLERPEYLVATLRRLQTILGIDVNKLRPRQKSTTFYESMISTLWLPKVRTVLVNDWEVHRPSAAIGLLETWKDVLPRYIYEQLMDQVIIRKLAAAIKEWKPRSRKEGRSRTPPHVWLFPWLQHLPDEQLNLSNSSSLLAEIKRKFRHVLDRWDISNGIIEGLHHWKEVLRGEMDKILRDHLLPRLAAYLRTNFEVNPQDQDLAPLEDVFKWKDMFRPSVMGELLAAEFFPKWHEILHIWLTSDPNYEEVGQWFTWWKSQIPEEIRDVKAVADEWDRGLEMMNQALELGDQAATELPPPVTRGEGIPADKIAAPEGQNGVHVDRSQPATPKAVEETSFKDLVEDWCTSEDLMLVPLREAHSKTGLPLFRITASASGKGGVQIYLKGDVVWAQNRKQRELWEPVALDNALVSRAEGK